VLTATGDVDIEKYYTRKIAMGTPISATVTAKLLR